MEGTIHEANGRRRAIVSLEVVARVCQNGPIARSEIELGSDRARICRHAHRDTLNIVRPNIIEAALGGMIAAEPDWAVRRSLAVQNSTADNNNACRAIG